MYETNTIRVPKPIAVGTSDRNAFVVFEYLSMGGNRSGDAAAKMGKVYGE
jgi:fructosamine-3-kinase